MGWILCNDYLLFLSFVLYSMNRKQLNHVCLLFEEHKLLHKLFESINPCYYYILSLISNRIWYERSMNHNKYRIQAKNPSSSPLFILTLYPTMIYTFSTINELNFLSLLIHHSTATNKRKSKASYSNQLIRIIAKISIFTGIFFFF